MTKTMQDSITVADLQLKAQNGDPVPDAFAGYDDGNFANAAQIKAIFPNVPVLAVTVFASDNEGDCLDVESGDATPSQAPGWVLNRRHAGHGWPTVYCSEAIEQAVRDEFAATGVSMPWLWLAAYPGEEAVVPNRPNVIGHQWIDRGPYDESVMLDTYPLFGPPPTPKESTVALSETVESNGQTHLCQVSTAWYHKWWDPTAGWNSEVFNLPAGKTATGTPRLFMTGTNMVATVEDQNGVAYAATSNSKWTVTPLP